MNFNFWHDIIKLWIMKLTTEEIKSNSCVASDIFKSYEATNENYAPLVELIKPSNRKGNDSGRND
jgi:hypothetical protein